MSFVHADCSGFVCGKPLELTSLGALLLILTACGCGEAQCQVANAQRPATRAAHRRRSAQPSYISLFSAFARAGLRGSRTTSALPRRQSTRDDSWDSWDSLLPRGPRRRRTCV